MFSNGIISCMSISHTQIFPKKKNMEKWGLLPLKDYDALRSFSKSLMLEVKMNTNLMWRN